MPKPKRSMIVLDSFAADTPTQDAELKAKLEDFTRQVATAFGIPERFFKCDTQNLGIKSAVFPVQAQLSDRGVRRLHRLERTARRHERKRANADRR